METIRIGSLDVSKFIIGGNPLSGFSHLTSELDVEMRHFFTTAQIKRLLRDAESLGINTVMARADHHIIRVLMEYWDEGGGLQWFAQTCPELGAIERGVENAIKGKASACYVHGGVTDNLLANGKLGEAAAAIDMIRAAGMPAGMAGHNPGVFRWAEEHLDVDFYMCCYYNPSSRVVSPESSSGKNECFNDEDRDAMVETIAGLSKPVIHYKVLAAGRKTPEEAFAFVAKHLRPSDGVCVGVYDGQKPDMLREDVEIFQQSLAPR